MTKVLFLLSTASPNVGFTKEKHVFITIKKLGFRCQIIASALDRTCVFKVQVERHLKIALGFQLMWVCTRSRPLVLERRCARS